MQILPMIQGYILPLTNDRKRLIRLACLAVAAWVAYKIRSIVVPPRSIRHLPRITYTRLIASLLRGDSHYEFQRQCITPLLNKADGTYLVPFPPTWAVATSNPRHIKTILSHPDWVPKDQGLFGHGESLIGRFLGKPNLGNTEGHEWRRFRKAMAAFKGEVPVQLFGDLTVKLISVMSRVQGSVPVGEMMERLTIDGLGLAAMDFDFNAICEPDSEWVATYGHIKAGIENPLFMIFDVLDYKWLRWMFPGRQQQHDALDRLTAMLEALVNERRAVITTQIEQGNNDVHCKDLLSMMLHAQLQDESQDVHLTTDELIANLLGFFFAGHDTTAASLSSVIWSLAVHKDVQEKAREEAIRVLGDAPQDITPTPQQVKELTYLNLVIKESLRMHGPATSVLPRRSAVDVPLNEYVIPKNTPVELNLMALHRDPSYFEKPDVFMPERFAKVPGTSILHDDGVAYVPFGFGGHQCIGTQMSMTEQLIVLAMLLRKFSWQLPADSKHKKEMVAFGLGVIGPHHLDVDFTPRY
ncbi:cytochrome P450 [Gongronella butleri]|nr:cytochrome P450 [Gongronella butleri]